MVDTLNGWLDDILGQHSISVYRGTTAIFSLDIGQWLSWLFIGFCAVFICTLFFRFYKWFIKGVSR